MSAATGVCPEGVESRTLVVMPTYQEAANIAEALRRVRAAVPTAAVLVVDDSSPDATADIARAVGVELGRIEVLTRPAKAGLGSAYRAGFALGLDLGYDVVVQMDSDLSHDPAALPALLAAVGDGADVAIGSRYVSGGAIPRWASHRRCLSRWGNAYAAWALGLPIADATSGFRAYRASALAAINTGTLRARGYGFQIETAHRMACAGARIVEVPIVFAERQSGCSKLSSAIVGEAMALVTWWGLRRWMHAWRCSTRTAPSAILPASPGASPPW